MNLISPQQPEIVVNFINWFNQLPSQDQNSLNSYLSSIYSTNQSKYRGPNFSGRTYGVATSNKSNKTTLIECNKCGNVITIG